MPRRRFYAALALLLILIVPLLIVNAQGGEGDDDMPVYGLVSVDNADIRVGPDFAYATIGRIPLNTSVEVLGRSGDFFRAWDGRQWLEINFGDRTGWVYARLLRTSRPFNSIHPTGRLLPRDADGRVPEVFDLTSYVCDQWQGDYTLSGDFMTGDTILTVTYPYLQGANVYSVIVISPSGFRTAFDSETTTAEIELAELPYEDGEYTWRVAPYWTNSSYRYRWQQICLLETGGTFQKPYTNPFATATPPAG